MARQLQRALVVSAVFLALLLPGSGPIDRDGDAPGMPLGIQLALAEALADAGQPHR